MYTQCPDCSTAFRVTADVLKQAAGKVRCGGCSNAFNALDYLSESIPQRSAPREADAPLPELTPDPAQKPDGLPASISAEQSAALLKTLDELAGSDIRIEDTGVEWRVLDDDDVGEAAADPVANEANAEASPANDLRADEVDELLEESPTPVDQFLTDRAIQERDLSHAAILRLRDPTAGASQRLLCGDLDNHLADRSSRRDSFEGIEEAVESISGT